MKFNKLTVYVIQSEMKTNTDDVDIIYMYLGLNVVMNKIDMYFFLPCFFSICQCY